MIEQPRNQFNLPIDGTSRGVRSAVNLPSGGGAMSEGSGMEHLEISQLAVLLWDYHKLDHTLQHSDCILALGGPDVRVAKRAAEIFHEGFAPIIVCTGGIAHSEDLLATGWEIPEAEVFAKTLKQCGVPDSAIIVEPKASNTGENIRFSHVLLDEAQINARKIIVTVKPHMERRAYATCRAVWPEVDVAMASQQINYSDYPSDLISESTIINLMVGDLQRIWLYGEKGFQIPQDVPDKVLGAFRELVRRGFDRHVVKNAAMSPK